MEPTQGVGIPGFDRFHRCQLVSIRRGIGSIASHTDRCWAAVHGPLRHGVARPERLLGVVLMTDLPLMRVEDADGNVHEHTRLESYRPVRDGAGNLVQVYTWFDEDTGYSWTRNVPVR